MCGTSSVEEGVLMIGNRTMGALGYDTSDRIFSLATPDL